jgi:tetratricopeptide (TPR) repeat protein
VPAGRVAVAAAVKVAPRAGGAAALKFAPFDRFGLSCSAPLIERRWRIVVRGRTTRMAEAAFSISLPRLTGVALALASALALAGCQSSAVPLSEGDASAGSTVNIDSLSTVIAQNPNDATTYNVRGSAYGRAGRFKEAIADFDAAIKIKPDFYQAYANRALVERRINKDDLAFADYNQAIQINPSYAVAYVGRGNMYRQRKQIDLALADFNKAISLDANDPRAYHNRGLIYQVEGQHVQAIDDFSKAISLAPTAAEPFNARGLSYLATGDYRAALDDFNEVVKRDKQSFEGWTNQGLALEKLGEQQKAFAAFAHAANLNPTYAPATEGMHRTAQGGGVALNQG